VRLRTVSILALVAGTAVVLIGVLTGAIGTRSHKDQDLDKIARQTDESAPDVGLGEGSVSPTGVGEWKTDFSKHLVPLDEFQSGGPPKDGIPAIDHPHFTQARDVDWLKAREPVILLRVGGQTRGYPLQILVWHEIVNDRLGEVPVAVTFCPLCNTAIAFDRRLGDRVLSFGTTGKLRDSDLVMYDRPTQTWWQQFSGQALVGALAGSKLRQLPARIVAWSEFRRAYPAALVLDRHTGFARSYGENPYGGYDRVDSPPFFGARNGDDDRLLPKERVVYVEVGERAYVLPFSKLAVRRRVSIETEDGELVVLWHTGVASALDTPSIAEGRNVGAASVLLDGKPVPFSEPFWFAVAAFRPDAEIVD
jgi:Protein of unknown function (DUF3179)